MADFYNNEFTFQNPKQKKYNELTQEQNQIDTQVNSNRESKYQDVIQEREQRAINQNKYGVDIPDEVYQVLNNGIANSDIPEETAYNIASAYKYSEMYGVPVEMAMENLESFNSLTFGSKQQATPKGNFEAICNSWQIGKNTLTMANLAADLREAEKNEDATLIANIEQQLALLESENNNLQDYQNRNFFIQSLKDGAQTLPYSGAVAIPGILNAFLPGLGTAAAGITSAELSSRLEYLNLRKSGATPEVARNVSSLSGIVQGATEMALGTVAKSLGTDKLGQVIGNKADDVVKAVLNKMHINSLGFSKVASAMVNYGLDATGEGVEEALQEFESFLGVVIAEKIQDEADGKIQVPEIQEMVNSAVQSFSAGFRSSLVLGGLANIPQGIASIQDAKAVKEAAQTIPSKEDFIKTTADSPIFEGMSDEKRKESQEEIYNSFEKQRSEILDSKAKDIDEVSDFQAGSEDNKIQEAEDTEEEVRGAAYRENGRLYTETDVTTDESGTVKGTFKIGNPTEETSYNRYGYINFTEGKDNTVTIENFKLTPGRQNLAVEMFEEFSEQFSDKNIIWKPKGKTGKALYKQLALNNPRGKNYGLSYFTENDTATIKDRHARLKLAKDMQQYFPNMSSAERATGVAIFESMAKSMGMGLDDYIQNTYRDGNVFADFSETGESATVIENGQKFFRKGAMTTFANDAKSIIYTTQHSDFSTFVHENAHVYRAHMTKELLEQAEKAFGVIDGDWNAKNYKTADGRTISYEEAFAEGFEDYLKTGQAKDTALKQIYDKIAQFMARIYAWMKNEARIDISPEIKNIYDQMLSGESSLAEAIAVTQKVDEQQREAFLAEQKKQQAQQKETEQKIFNDESTAEEIKEAKVEDIINSDTVAEDVKVEKILETVTDEQAEKELENINIDDIPVFQTITGEGLERLLRNNAKMQEALEKAKTFSSHGYSFDEFKTGDFVFRKIANKWAIETDDKRAYLGRKNVFDGIKKASNIKFSAMYQAALAKAQGNTEVAKEFVKSSNLIGTTLERNRFTLADVLGYEELYTAYPWMKTIPVKFVSIANKNLVNITENEIEINPFAGTFEELGPALLEKTQEILNKHQGISADTDIFNPKLDTALKSLIDKATLINREFRNYNDFIDASYEEVKDDLNYQIIGEIGAKALDDAEEATTRLDNLSIARQMEEQGKDALTIRLATGWEKGVDEQWRYEIDDVISFYNEERYPVRNLERDSLFEEIDKRIKESNYDFSKISEQDKQYWESVIDSENEYIREFIVFADGKEFWKKSVTLDRVVNAPELFKAYPQLKNVQFKIEKLGSGYRGSFNEAQNTLKLDESANVNTLLHEIQHAIQEIEGFARGGNTETFTPIKPTKLERALAGYAGYSKEELSKITEEKQKRFLREEAHFTEEEITDALPDINGLGNIAQIIERAVKNGRLDILYEEMQEAANSVQKEGLVDLSSYRIKNLVKKANSIFEKQSEEWQSLVRQYNEASINRDYEKTSQLSDEIEKIDPEDALFEYELLMNDARELKEGIKDFYRTPLDVYTSLAGEVEARNVQNRMYMTSDERRKKLLQDTADVAALDQIILHQTDYASVIQEWEEENKQNKILFQEIEDKEEIARLESEEKITAYRAMELIDGKLYPPMAGKVDGKLVNPLRIGSWIKADERPDLAQGKVNKRTGETEYFFNLKKAGKDSKGKSIGDVLARYNPYWHSSLSPLNDQFSTAYKRPTLVTVEVQIPKYELEGKYKAEKAKDSVGQIDWHSGPISSKLAEYGKPRQVILSQYNKVLRVVPDAEVAQKIKEQLEGTNIAIRDDLVTPSLAMELEKAGVPVEHTDVVKDFYGIDKNTVLFQEEIEDASKNIPEKTVINRDTFFKDTYADWQMVKKHPDREPDYKSKSGSEYWYEKDGVYRRSNHWGNVASCWWLLDGNQYQSMQHGKGLSYAQSKKEHRKKFDADKDHKYSNIGFKNNDIWYEGNTFVEFALTGYAKWEDISKKYDIPVDEVAKREVYQAVSITETDNKKFNIAYSDDDLKNIYDDIKHNLTQYGTIEIENPEEFKKFFENYSWEDFLNDKNNNNFSSYVTFNESRRNLERIYFQSSPAEELESIREQYENTDKWLKAPNGNDTNLTEKQWLQVRTPQFKEWFGDWENDPENASKVVDENGEPLVVYHGTSYQFDKFVSDEIGKTTKNKGIFGNGFYFSNSKEMANYYTKFDKTKEGKVLNTYLNIRNPFIWSDSKNVKVAKNLGFPKDRIKDNKLLPLTDNEKIMEFTKELKDAGYDGVIYNYPKNFSGYGDNNVNEIAAFYPNQIKSATDNSGEFNAGNPSILFHTAYHGSPHNFDNFTTSAIGTGEGAQAFGWGLYFTNQEDIARWYADKLANEPLRLTLSSKKDFLKTRKKSLKDVENKEKYEARIYKNIKHFDKELKQAKKEKDQSQVDFYQKLIDESFEQLDETYRISLIDSFKKDIEVINNEISELKKSMKNNRNLYTVELPDNGYLFWDKIVDNDELEIIKSALKEKGIDDLSRIENLQGYQEQYKNNKNATYTIGSNIYEVIADYLGSDKASSLFLKDLGYIGIDYPADGLSGNTDEGKRNYVIFDEADINVIEHINYQDVPEEFLDSVNDATLKEAASFESWQDFMEYYETANLPKNIDIPQDVTAGWYQRTWELAHNLKPSESINREEYLAEELAAGDTALVDDALFMTELSGSSNMLIPFLKAINYYKNTEEWQPQDAEDEQELERFRRIKNRVEYEIRHASILTNALRVAQGKPLTNKARRTLLSLIQANVRDYRALYADIMYEDRFAVNLADTNKGKVKIANPNMDVDTMSPEQLKEIADKIEFEELANKIKKGELLMDDEINRYINMLESQIKASDKKVKEAQKALEDEKLETSQDYKRISDWQQRQLLKYYDELLEAKGKLYEKDKRNLKKAEKGLKIAEPYQLDRNRRQSNYDTIFRQFQDMKKITEITGEVKEAMAHRDALYEAKLENSKLKEAAKALSETREIQKKLVKRAMRKIDFKTVDYEQAVKIIAIQETFEPLLLDGLNQWIDTDNPYLRTVYYDFKTDPEFAQKLEERSERKGGKSLRYLINLMKTKDIEEWTVDEKKKARQSLPRNDYIREFGIENLGRYRKGSLQLDLQSPEIQKMLKDTLSIDLYAAISGKPFVKWTITEMAELAELIGDLYAEGKSMLRAKQEAKKQEATRIRAKIEEVIRTGGIEIPDDAPEEEKEKYRKLLKKREAEILGYESTIQGTLQSDVKRKSLRNRLRHRGYSDATILRVARILDGNKEGENTKLLYYGADEAYNSKHRHIRERQQKIEKALIDNDIKVEELYKQITLGNFYKNGESATFTVDELLFFAEADKDRPPEDKTNNFDGGTAYEAVVYGNMASPQEKEAIRQSLMDVTLSDDDLGLVQAQYKGMCEARFERIMQLVKTLDPKFLKFAEAIAYDYEKEFERMNKASIEEFNQPVWRVKKYIPLIRLGQTGEENENRVKEDLLGTSGIQNQNWVNKGMTQKRIKISPWNQRPVEIGLYKTWLDAVDRTEHFIAYSGYVRSLNRVYKSRDANGNRALMEAMYGKGMVTYIDDYINELANPTPTGQRTALDKICRTLRGKTAPAYLAWKMSGIIKQFCTSPWPYFQYLTPAEYISASYDFVKNYPELSASIKEKSVFMNSRVMDPVLDIIKEQQQKVTNKVGYGLNQFNAMGMKGLEMVDWMCVAPGWLATYRKEFANLEKENANLQIARDKMYKDNLDRLIAENEKVEVYMMKTMEELEEEAKQDLPKVLTQAELEQKAVSKADDITRRCQPSSRAEDLSPLFKNSGKNAELVKILLQFQTSLNVIWNNIRYDLPQAIKERNYHQIIGAIAGYAVAGIAMGLVTGGPYGDDEDDKETSLAKQILYYGTTQFTDSIPVIGSYITTLNQMLITGKGGMMYSNNTFPVLNEAMSTVQSAIKGKWDKAAINFGEGVGYFLGLPVSGTKELLESAGLRDDEKGAEFNPGAFLGWRE